MTRSALRIAGTITQAAMSLVLVAWSPAVRGDTLEVTIHPTTSTPAVLFPIIRTLLREERKMVLVAGPRQVGKTTLAKHYLGEAGCDKACFNWDIDSHRKAILRSPEDFWRGPLAGLVKPCMALDEIHKYPRWKRFLKGLHDAVSPEVEILVTGSGRLDIYQRGGDSLLGRYNLFRLHPFTVGEFVRPDRTSLRPPEEMEASLREGAGEAPGQEEALREIERFTGFPEPLFAGSDARLRRWRRSRNQLVLREDLRDLTRIREIGLIESLVELLPERVGSPLSLNSLREDLGVAFGTVQAWIRTLERLYYVFEIRPFAGKLARALRREGKVYLFDISAIEDPGARFENLVALHLLKARDAWNDLGLGDFGLHYVRDREKREVDFLMTRDRRPYLLLEAKLASQDASPSLLYFQERLRPRWAIQLVRRAPEGPSRMRGRGVLSLAAAGFLSLLP